MSGGENHTQMKDITSIACGTTTRDKIKSYRDTHGHANMDEALVSLLQEVNSDN
jgi:PleD family two-component response regulator